MNGFIVVGTDTDAGKTAFSILFLTAFGDRFSYWKPVETGESDSAKVRHLVPGTQVFEPLARFEEAVAPALAARRAGLEMPQVVELLSNIPNSPLPLLIETFGSPFSPWNDRILQLEAIRAWKLPIVLVTPSTVGAIGRTLQTFRALAEEDLSPCVVVLLGADDHYAREEIEKHTGMRTITLLLPSGEWTNETFQAIATEYQSNLDTIRTIIEGVKFLTAKSFDIHLDLQVIWHPYSPLRGGDSPLPVVAAEREFLMLADGRRIIDGISSWWTILHGHRQPEIMRAIRKATRTLDHVLFAGATHPDAVELGEALLQSMPWPEGGRIFYSDNGSTAIEVALKMAYQFWCHRGEAQRTLFIGFEGGYHGDTFGAMSIGRNPLFFGRFEPLLFQTLRIPIAIDALARSLEENRGKIAAIVIEPIVQGAGGMRMHTPELLRSLFDIAREFEVPVIADEVMTGFGRTGSLFAFEKAWVAPDLVCLAKGITGGTLPLAATLAAPKIVAAFDSSEPSNTFFHGHSFTANPIACAAALASWNLMQTHKWRIDVARIEKFWQQRLRPFAQLKHVQEVRIAGLIAAIEIDVPGGYLAGIGPMMKRECLARGVMLRPLGSVLYAMPPLCTSVESLERIASAMENAIRMCGL